jgi:hypothetical protein
MKTSKTAKLTAGQKVSYRQAAGNYPGLYPATVVDAAAGKSGRLVTIRYCGPFGVKGFGNVLREDLTAR